MTAAKAYRFAVLAALLILLVGLAAAGVVLFQRWQNEASNRHVALTADWKDVQQLACASGMSEASVLAALAASGLNSVAVSEDLLNDLVASNRVKLQAVPAKPGAGETTWLICDDQRLGRRLERIFKQLRPPTTRLEKTAEGWRLNVAAPWSALQKVGCGFDRQVIETIEGAKLEVVARPSNYPALTPGRIVQLFSLLPKSCRLIIFSGKEAFGNPGLLDTVENTLVRRRLRLGVIEFFKQQGITRLALERPDYVVRVHSISPQELALMSHHQAVERFSRAVKERNIRVCYVRFAPKAAKAPVQEATEYVKALKAALEAAGFTIGRPEPFKLLPSLAVLLLLLGAACGAACSLLRLQVMRPQGWVLALFTAGPMVVFALVALAGSGGVKFLALFAAIIFPTLGYFAFIDDYSLEKPLRWAQIIGQWLALSLVSLAGGLLIAALLARLPFMLHLQQFAGVKLAQLVPLALVAGIGGFGLGRRKLRPVASLKAIAEHWKHALEEPTRLLHLLVAFALLALVALWMVRSGNEGMGVSGLELKVRSFLEAVLGARPRTKEFLFAHPLMLLAIGLKGTSWRRFSFPLAVLGMIGQVSLVNTFCHVHTPLAYSLLRTFNGLWLGAAIGLPLVWFIRRLAAKSDE